MDSYIGAGEKEGSSEGIRALNMTDRVIRTGYLQGQDRGCVSLRGPRFIGLGNDAGGRIALEPMACGLPIVGNMRCPQRYSPSQ